MVESAVDTAKAIDSHIGTLRYVLLLLQPATIFEWGPGASTREMLKHDFVKHIDTVEHEWDYYCKARGFCLDTRRYKVYIESTFDYVHKEGRLKKYDLIFIDGSEREITIMDAHTKLADDGVVILHDAERPEYTAQINSYSCRLWTDEGHTVILTNSRNTYEKLREYDYGL